MQFKNHHNSCYASSLVQNIMSSGPMQRAIMNSDLSDLSKSTEMKLGYNHIHTLMYDILKHKPGEIMTEEEHKSLFDVMLSCESSSYKMGDP